MSPVGRDRRSRGGSPVALVDRALRIQCSRGPRDAAFAILFALIVGCAPSGGVRYGPGGQCQSDRDCFYGLTCRASEGVAARTCVLQTYGPCDTDDDCYSGRRCLDGSCVVECVTARDCPDARPACVVGACEASNRLRCVTDGDCGVGEECVGGRCLLRMGGRCLSDFDCPPSSRCIAGRCR